MPKKNDFKLDVVSVRLVKDAPIYSEHTFNNPADIAAVMGDCMCQFDREVVCVVNLRSDLKPINVHFASVGSLNEAMAHPRELFKSSILSNAASNGVIYKDVCNPITAEFREELYTNILDAYARIKEPEKEETQKQERTKEMPEFSVTVTPYEREGSNIKGLARIYFENSFIVNNINIVQGKEKIFVSMPSYKTKQVDEQGKPIYQDVCYPVTKDFRERLYNEIISEYEKAKDKSNEKARESAEKHHGNPDKEKDKEATPFR